MISFLFRACTGLFAYLLIALHDKAHAIARDDGLTCRTEWSLLAASVSPRAGLDLPRPGPPPCLAADTHQTVSEWLHVSFYRCHGSIAWLCLFRATRRIHIDTHARAFNQCIQRLYPYQCAGMQKMMGCFLLRSVPRPLGLGCTIWKLVILRTSLTFFRSKSNRSCHSRAVFNGTSCM